MFQSSTQAPAHRQSGSPRVEDMIIGSEITFASTVTNGEQKPRKMRASCDACSRAKVQDLPFELATLSDTDERSNATK
jgi:hypothetical protein